MIYNIKCEVLWNQIKYIERCYNMCNPYKHAKIDGKEIDNILLLDKSGQLQKKLEQKKPFKLWRYIDSYKLNGILEKKALYFSTPKQQSNNDELDSVYNHEILNLCTMIKDVSKNTPIKELKNVEFFSYLTNVNDILRENIGISCWYMGDYENFNLWRSYKSNVYTTLVIQTTLNELLKVLSENNQDKTFIVGNINYKNNSFSENIDKDFIQYCFSKRIYYKDENELRIITSLSDHINLKEIINKDFRYAKEIYEKINFSNEYNNYEKNLIKISEKWFKSLQAHYTPSYANDRKYLKNIQSKLKEIDECDITKENNKYKEYVNAYNKAYSNIDK